MHLITTKTTPNNKWVMDWQYGFRSDLRAGLAVEKQHWIKPYECQMALIDFTLSNARRFYSSMGNPLGLKGLSPVFPSLQKVVDFFACCDCG